MKIFIIGGGGTLGSTAAFTLAVKGLADEIILYDRNDKMSAHHANDINQATSIISKTKVRPGKWDDMKKSDIIIIAVGIPIEKQTSSHTKDAVELAPLIKEISKKISLYSPEALVITMSNPVDVLNYYIYLFSGLKACQLIGFSYNDVIRARWSIGTFLGISPEKIYCGVIGEHGASRVPLYSSASINGNPSNLTEKDISMIEKTNTHWWSEFLSLDIQRTAGWTSAVGVTTIIEHILGIQKGPVCCSCVLSGELGYHDFSMGLEAELNLEGVKKILPIRANSAELAQIEISAQIIKNGINDLKLAFYE